MGVRTDLSDKACSIARGADVLADPWVLLVLRELFQGNDRFDAIVRSTGAAESVIARRLALLVERGLVVTEPYEAGARARHAYRLTAAGRGTLPVLHALSQWSAAYDDDPRAVHVVCQRCGTETTLADWCEACAAPLAAEEVAWYKPSSPDILTPLLPR